METKKYAWVKKYAGHTLERDTRYSVLYSRHQFGTRPPTAAIHIRPHEARDDHPSTIRLNLVRLPAGTTISDAVALLALAVPAVYRDLWHSITVDQAHRAEWEGERNA